MASRQILLLLLTAQQSAAQTDLLGSIFSVAESFVTSLFAPASTTGSSSATQQTSTNAASLTSSTPTSAFSTSQTAAPASSPTTASSASTAAAAQASQTSTSASNGGGGGGGSNTLAIVLGCTLGALALAAFLALCFFCRRRRRRSKNVSKHKNFSTSDDEVESWHHEKPRVRSLKEPMTEVNTMNGTSSNGPLMHDQTALNHGHQGGQNPFVPVPPPTRRSMHNSTHDNTAYSAHPFHPDDVNAHHLDSNANTAHGHAGSHALAAGAGGAALGGLASHAKHHHDRKRSASRGRVVGTANPDQKFSEDERHVLPEAANTSRRSGSVGRASTKEPWPYMESSGKKSLDGARSGNGGLAQSHDEFSTPKEYPTDRGHGVSGSALMGSAVAGGLAGAAISHKSKSRSPHRKGILKQNPSDSSSNPSSLTTEDYLPSALSMNTSRPRSTSGPHELATSDAIPASHHREGHSSALGVAAPLAATVAANETAAQRRQTGSGGPHSLAPQSSSPVSHRESVPIVPSRSPKRNSLEHSRARHSSATEGTAELPSQQLLVSPSVKARKSTENDGLLSPVSPISRSQSGSWSKAPAEPFAAGHVDHHENTSSQESTVVNPALPHDGLQHNEQQSSGLVSAIQRIFNSGKPVPEDHQSLVGDQHSSDIAGKRETRLRTVAHRKPAPDRSSHQPQSYYGDIADQQQNVDVMPGSFENAPRRSGESARSLPPRYRPHSGSFNNTQHHDFAAVPTGTHHQRSRSRSGYGLGSGDPFDLARTRTDSSMTGVSLSNYQEPTVNGGRPHSWRQSSSSDNREPTLAELRREVVAEDRNRAQQAWRKSHPHSRSNSAGLRYGDDRELFNLVDQTTGHGRYYTATPQERRGNSGGHVGRAY